MSTTTSKGVPVPANADTFDIHRDFLALANWVDAHGWGGVFTTAQRDVLVAPNLWPGMVIFNTTTARIEQNATGTPGAANWGAASVSAPSDAAAGTPSLRTLGTGAQQAAAGNDPRFADSRTPSGAAGGKLSGTYPNPGIAAGAVTDAEVATSNKDGAAAVPSMRTLGPGSQQAAAGDHGHADLAPKASPALTGTPTAPTPAPGTNTTQIATAAFVQAAIGVLLGGAPPAALDTLKELADALGDDANFAATMTNALALKAPLASPNFSGNPTAPTAAPGDNDTSIANTAFVQAALTAAVALLATKASPSLTGTVTIGGADTDVEKVRAIEIETDARTVTIGRTGSQITSITEKSGATTVKTTTITYSGTQLSTVVEVAGGVTVTTTFNYTAGVLTGTTRSVA